MIVGSINEVLIGNSDTKMNAHLLEWPFIWGTEKKCGRNNGVVERRGTTMSSKLRQSSIKIQRCMPVVGARIIEAA